MTDPNIRASGMKIRSKDLEPIAGWMVASFKASGLITICTAWVSIPGPMEDAIWASTRTIRSMVTVSTNGLMVVFTWASGCVASNMALECTRQSSKTLLRQQ